MRTLTCAVLALALSACDDGVPTNNADTDYHPHVDDDDPATEDPLPFVPFLVEVSASLAYNTPTESGGSGTIGPWVDAGESVGVAVDMLILEQDFEHRGAQAMCALRLVPNEERLRSTDNNFTNATGTYAHHGLTLASGAFTAIDAAIETDIGTIRGCSEVEIDIEFWGSDLQDLIEAQAWGMYWGNMAPEVLEHASTAHLGDLIAEGYVIGGSMHASAHFGNVPLFLAEGYALDEAGELVSSGEDLDSWLRVHRSDLPPSASERNALIRFTPVFRLFAAPLLIGRSQ